MIFYFYYNLNLRPYGQLLSLFSIEKGGILMYMLLYYMFIKKIGCINEIQMASYKNSDNLQGDKK